MANEANIVELWGNPPGLPVHYVVANGTAISKGCLLKLTDPRTGAASSAAGDIFAGIAAADKEANDGATKIAAYTAGIFDLVASGVITAGHLVMLSGANLVATCNTTAAELLAALSAGRILGKALETSTDAERIEVKIGVNI